MRKNKFPLLLLLFVSMGCNAISCKTSLTEVVEDTKSATSDQTATKTKKVLFIGIDGCVWKGITTTNAPNLRKLMDESWTSTNALAEIPTWSSNGWSALLTGVGVAKHKAADNSFSNADFTNYPSFFRVIKTENPTLRTTSIATWSSINDIILSSQDLNVKYTGSSDDDTEQKIITALTTDNSDVSFCHFDDVDHAGHASNYRTTTQLYMDAIKATDLRVGRILNAVRSRANYSNEDWLIVVSTDHGGDLSHGGNSYLERNTFIILNNTAITPVLINELPTAQVETRPYAITTVNFKKDIYGQLPNLSGLNMGANGSFTIEFRVRATSSVSDPVIIGNKDWTNGYNKGIIISNRSGVIRANFGDGSHRLDLDGVNLTDGRWHHVAITVDRSTQKATLYDGGIQVAQSSISAVGSMQTNTNFKIGQDVTGSYDPFFSGNIAEIRIFNTVVPASVLAANAFNEITASHPNSGALLLYTKGNETLGSLYNGTLVSPSITLVGKNNTQITRTALTDPILYKETIDYHNAPYLYSVAPTILNFLGLQRPANYDGSTLVNF